MKGKASRRWRGRSRPPPRRLWPQLPRPPGRKLTLEPRGTKAIGAFDSWIVVVSVKAWSVGKSYRLKGAFPCSDEDTPRGAVMAVLDAFNRILERFLGD